MNIQDVHLLLMTSTALNIYILSSHFAFENVGRRLSKVPIKNTSENFKIFSPFSSFVFQIDRTYVNPVFNFGFGASLLYLSVVS